MFPRGTKRVSSLQSAIVSLDQQEMRLEVPSADSSSKARSKKDTSHFHLLHNRRISIPDSFQWRCSHDSWPLCCWYGIGDFEPHHPYLHLRTRTSIWTSPTGWYLWPSCRDRILSCQLDWIRLLFAHGDVSWRLGLAMQCPLALLLMALSFTLPQSPRWCRFPLCQYFVHTNITSGSTGEARRV
jgi:hypothetical protein